MKTAPIGLLKAIDSLFLRDRTILKLRSGLWPGKTKFSLSEIGKMLRISKERVRQLEFLALPRMGPKFQKYLKQAIQGKRA